MTTTTTTQTAAIVETDVFGVKAWHFECDCGEQSRRYEREATAVKAAKRHHATVATSDPFAGIVDVKTNDGWDA